MESVPQLLKYGCATHTGNVRDHNEDSYASDAGLGLWLIADGMGGHKNGELASSIARDTVVQLVRQGKSLSGAIQKAHKSILQSGKDGDGTPGMGATIVAIVVQDNNYEIAWVGDSRAYLFDGEKLRLISKDHSYVQLLLDNGSISKEEALNHQKSNLIYQCLGSLEHKKVDVSEVMGEFLKGQKILLCSDGLNDEVNDTEIESIVAGDTAEQKIADRLIEAALSQEGKDNVTVLIISAPDTAPDRFRMTIKQPVVTQEFTAKPIMRNSKTWAFVGIALLLSLIGGWVYYYVGTITV